MPDPPSSRPGRSRARKRGASETRAESDARKANLRESLAPRAAGIPPEVQKQLIVELLEATATKGKKKQPPKR